MQKSDLTPSRLGDGDENRSQLITNNVFKETKKMLSTSTKNTANAKRTRNMNIYVKSMNPN